MKFPHLEKLPRYEEVVESSKGLDSAVDGDWINRDDAIAAVESDFAELTAPRDASPELVDAEVWLRDTARTNAGPVVLTQRSCSAIVSELDHLRARIAVLESERSDAETRGRRKAFEEAAEDFYSDTLEGFNRWLQVQRDACGKDVRR